MTTIPCFRLSFSAKCTIRFLKSAGRTSAKSAIVTCLPPAFSSPHRFPADTSYGTSSSLQTRSRRSERNCKLPILPKRSFGYATCSRTFLIPNDDPTLLHLDGASPALGNKLFRSLASFRALEGSTSIRRERVTVRSSRELCWNSGKSEWLFTCLPRSLTGALVFIARAENYQTHAHGLATSFFLSRGALAGTCQAEAWRFYQRGFCRRVSVTT